MTDGPAPDPVVHELAGPPGAPPLLVSHATGFHGRCYRALAEALGGRFRVVAIDHRGHGATPAPEGFDPSDWRGYGADTLALARRLAESHGGPIVGFGHSMGGATLILAAHAEPGLFERLVLFEPIGAPRMEVALEPDEIPLVAGARRRRRRFASLEEAHRNYASKPPLAALPDDVLWDYVRHGFAPAADGEGVELRCTPEHEAATFVGGFNNGVWELLPEVPVPVTVIGSGDGQHPAELAPAFAERLPAGGFVVLAELTHFGPLTHPDVVAALI